MTATKILSNANSVTQLFPNHLPQHLDTYLHQCELSLHSPKSIYTRRVLIGCLIWFLNHREFRKCDTSELQQFFHYLMHGHEEPGGRFGNPRLTRPASPATVRDYYICLRSFFKWLMEAGITRNTPFDSIPKPRFHESTRDPLTQHQVEKLFTSIDLSQDPLRDTALLLFLLDTGCRAGEVVALNVEDIDLANRCCEVLGKGRKKRLVYFGEHTADALRHYLRNGGRLRADYTYNRDSALFLPVKNSERFTVSGLRSIVRRLTKVADIKTSCSPHAFRRTFAVQTLRNGANVFSVQAMLGHTNLEMTRQYCRMAVADVENQHRHFAPVDRFEFVIQSAKTA